MLLALLLLACGAPTPPAPRPPAAPPAAPDRHVGSGACAGCHPDATAAWSASTHAAAERPVDAVAHAFPDPAHPAVELPGPHGPEAHPVVRVIGVEPLWQPLVAADGGRLQVSSRAYDPARGEWFEVFDDARAPGDWGHWSGRGMTWNVQCAACHDTGVVRGWDPARDAYATTFAELGVGCEACHGPSSRHAADPSVPTPGPHDRDGVAATCESCHVRWTPATEAYALGEPLLQHGLPALPGAGDDWRPDGGVLDESFEAVAFRLSRMHDAGVRCTDCHVPHTGALRAEGDALCLTCHAATPEHAHHAPDQASCVACHMPVTTYMQRDPRHDHGLRVPDPALDAKLGLRSACDACHDDRAAMLRAARAWWTPPEQPRRRARALHAVRQGASDADARVAAALADEPHPLWRAVLVGVSSDPGVRLDALASDDPWLRRAGATDAPPDPALQRALLAAQDDPIRAVRLEAATALQPRLAPDDPRMAELRAHLERLGDQASAVYALGAWWAGHGRPDRALPHLRRAVDLDPASAEAWRTLAITLAAARRPTEAVAALDRAVDRLPEVADLHFTRGLALAGAGRGLDAEAAFREALARDPGHGRAAYNLGLALHGRGEAEGVRWLDRAATLRPDDPAPPYALATVHAAAGDLRRARAAVDEALRRDPSHGPAAALRAGLEAGARR